MFSNNNENILKDIIKNRQIIDIQTSDKLNSAEYTGICLVANTDILMFLNYDEKTKIFNGFTILKNEDFESYYIWEEEDYEEIKKDNSQEQLKGFKLEQFTNLPSSIATLTNQLIAVFDYSDLEAYHVGKVLSVSFDSIELDLINQKAEWIGKQKIALKDIAYIGFGTEYEKTLSEKVTPLLKTSISLNMKGKSSSSNRQPN